MSMGFNVISGIRILIKYMKKSHISSHCVTAWPWIEFWTSSRAKLWEFCISLCTRPDRCNFIFFSQSDFRILSNILGRHADPRKRRKSSLERSIVCCITNQHSVPRSQWSLTTRLTDVFPAFSTGYTVSRDCYVPHAVFCGFPAFFFQASPRSGLVISLLVDHVIVTTPELSVQDSQ